MPLGGGRTGHKVLVGHVSYLREERRERTGPQKPNLRRWPKELAREGGNGEVKMVSASAIFNLEAEEVVDIKMRQMQEREGRTLKASERVEATMAGLMELGVELVKEGEGGGGERPPTDVQMARRVPTAIMRMIEWVREHRKEEAVFARPAEGGLPARGTDTRWRCQRRRRWRR